MLFIRKEEKKVWKAREDQPRIQLPKNWYDWYDETYPDHTADIELMYGKMIVVIPPELDDRYKARAFRFLESLDPLLQEITGWRPEKGEL